MERVTAERRGRGGRGERRREGGGRGGGGRRADGVVIKRLAPVRVGELTAEAAGWEPEAITPVRLHP